LATVLFTFLEGYNYIFAEIHGTSEGITGLCFVGIIIGLFLSLTLVPLIYRWAKVEMTKAEEQGRDKIDPEFRLWVCGHASSDRSSTQNTDIYFHSSQCSEAPSPSPSVSSGWPGLLAPTFPSGVL
jgi:hypothetical protein